MAAVSLSYNDLVSRARTFATAISTATIAGPCIVFSVAISGGASNCDVELYNATATSGSPIIQVNCLLGKSNFVTWEPCGIKFDTALMLNSNGTPDTITVAYIEL